MVVRLEGYEPWTDRVRSVERAEAPVFRFVRFNTTTIAKLLWVFTAVVLGLGVLREFAIHQLGMDTVLKNLRHFALDTEHSLPAWYESMTMAVAAGILATIAALSRRHDPRNRMQWSLLAFIFILMSIDESVSFHESTIEPLRQAFNLSGYLYFSWVIIAAPLLAIMAILYAPFLLRLPRQTAIRFVIAGALFVGGAFGVELVGGHYASLVGFESASYKIAATSEECLEIVGMTLFLTSLMKYLADISPMMRVDIRR